MSFLTDSAGSVRDSSDGARGGSRQAGDFFFGGRTWRSPRSRSFPFRTRSCRRSSRSSSTAVSWSTTSRSSSGKDGLFISMPSRKRKNGEFKDVAHPLNNETRRMDRGPDPRRVPTRSQVGGEPVATVASVRLAGYGRPAPRRRRLAAAPERPAAEPEPTREQVARGGRGDAPPRLLLERDLNVRDRPAARRHADRWGVAKW